MTLVEKFSIIGSVASAIAIVVSFTVFTIQRQEDIARRNSDRANELLAIKKIITVNCELIKTALLGNQKIVDMVLSKKYADVLMQKTGNIFYIIFKDGYNDNTKEYSWKTSYKFYFVNKFIDTKLLVLAKHNQDIITSITGIFTLIDDVNNVTEALINDLVNHNYTLVTTRAGSVKVYSEALMTRIDTLMVELSMI